MDLVLLHEYVARRNGKKFEVSILILMDLVLLPSSISNSLSPFKLGFNPYFNGSSTSTRNILVWVFSIVNKFYINSKSFNEYLKLI